MNPLIHIPADATVKYSESGAVWLDSCNIIISVTVDGREHTLEDAKDRILAFDKIYNGVPRPLIVDFTLVKSINREAREYYSCDKNKKKIKALAIVTGSVIGRLVGNFFMRIHNNQLPSKIFSNVEEAKKWAIQFI